MTTSYVWSRVEKLNNDLNENQEIEAFTGQLFVHLFKVLCVSQTEYHLNLVMLLEQLWAKLHLKYLFSSMK